MRREPRWNGHLVQILVVVANIQMRTLKAEVEKGSMRTVFGHGLVGSLRHRLTVYTCASNCTAAKGNGG